MSTIHKYIVSPSPDVQEIMAPSDSSVLSTIEQNGHVVVYMLVPDPNAGRLWAKSKRLLVVGTGWDFEVDRDSEIRFINTVKVGTFVWHVMEVVHRNDHSQNRP